jgi:IS5 family transposase
MYGNRIGKRISRREVFLDTMEHLVPWKRLEEEIRLYYFKGKGGRSAKGIQPMLSMYLLQIWFNLADEALEEHIYDSYGMRKFMGLDFSEEGAPDATTLLGFRRVLERHGLQKKLFETVKEGLEEQGKILRGGSIIEAPSSTKNWAKSRNPEMHQCKKGNEWHFGMKAHIGVDAYSGMVHRVRTTVANVSDGAEAGKVI